MKKGLVTVLGASLAIGVLSSCGGNSVSMNQGAEVKLNGDNVYPIECKDTLTLWTGLPATLDGRVNNLAETPFAEELEKQTGIKIEYIHPQAGQNEEQFNIMLASNELPDMVEYDWNSYGGGAESAIKEKYILPLNDIFKNYAPALTAYLGEHPEVDKKIKTDNGEYYSFPFVRGEEWMSCAQGMILRKDWLDKLGLDEPKTIDELETVLKGFKSLGASSPLVLGTYQIQAIIYAYGTTNTFHVDNGKVVYGPSTEEYKHCMEKLAQWYKEGLLDNNLVSVDAKYIQSRILNGDAGAFYGYVVSGMGAMLDAKPNDEFKLTPIAQPTLNGGKPEYGYKEDSVFGSSAVAITTNCKNPELAARFLDFGYTEAGHNLYNFGIEGESYNMVDGKTVFTDLIKHNPEGLSFAKAAVMYCKGSYSGTFIHDPEYVRQSLSYPEQQKAYDAWADTNMVNHLLPPLSLKSEEIDESSEILSNVNTYNEEQAIAFITGKTSIDTFDSYVKQLKDYGLDTILGYYQDALNRYNNR